MLLQPSDLIIGMLADNDHPRCTLQDIGIGQLIAMINFDDFKFVRLTTVFNAKPHTDVIGIGKFLCRAQEMHQCNLTAGGRRRRGLGWAVAIARRRIVERFRCLNDGLPFLAGDRQRHVIIKNARHCRR